MGGRKAPRAPVAPSPAAFVNSTDIDGDFMGGGAKMVGPPRCVDCGTFAPAEATSLASCGLEFRCMLVGRPCNMNVAVSDRSPLAPGVVPVAPVPQWAPLPGFIAHSEMAAQ